MPFGFLRRGGKKAAGGPAAPAASAAAARRRSGVPFDGLTEEWRLVGVMEIETRMSDALNKREPVPIRDVTWVTPEQFFHESLLQVGATQLG